MAKIKYDVKVGYNHFIFEDCNEALQYAIKSVLHAEKNDVSVEIELTTEDEDENNESEGE